MSVQKMVLSKDETGFTMLRNNILQNVNDALALGVWVYLASLPPNWVFYKEQLQAHFNMGRDKMNRVFNVLKDVGLIVIENKRDSKGKFIHMNLHVCTMHNIKLNEQAQEPAPILGGYPVTENPLTDNQLLDNNSYKDIYKNKDNKKEKDNIYIPDFEKSGRKRTGVSKIKNYKADERFMRFYNAYPKKVDPQDAWKAFKSIVGDDDILLDEIVMDIEKRKDKHSQWKERQYIKHPAVYLRKGEYLGEIYNAQDDVIAKKEQEAIAAIERIAIQEKASKERAEKDRINQIQKQTDGAVYRNIQKQVGEVSQAQEKGLQNLRNLKNDLEKSGTRRR